MRLSLSRPVEVPRIEALRYLRGGDGLAVAEDLERAVSALQAALHPAAAAEIFPLAFEEDAAPLLGTLRLPGASIARQLAGCTACAVLGVTLGFEVDRLIACAGQRDPYRALLLDACATAAVEDLADQAAALLPDQLTHARGCQTRRFSPGYGDLPLALQPALLERIDARRAIGLTAGGSLLLSPIKSVTALIGLSDDACDAQRHGCAVCSMAGRCVYRSTSD